jgi:hypothetical protein
VDDIKPPTQPQEQVPEQVPVKRIIPTETEVAVEPQWQPGPAPTSTGNPKPKRKANAVALTLGILAVLLLALLAGALYMKWTEANKATADLKSTQSELQNTKTALQSMSDAYDKATAGQSLTASKSDDQLITAAVVSRFHAQAGHATDTVDVKVSKKQGDFATATVSVTKPTELSYNAILKKVDGTWQVIFEGQGEASADVVKLYDIPAGL